MDCEYHAPESLAEACALLRERDGARILAGGTDLIVQMRSGVLDAGCIVDIKRLGLDQISEAAEGFFIGAATPHADIAENPLIRAHLPALADACRAVGGAATRNRGTLGGNVMNASPVADTVPVLMAYDAVAHLTGEAGERRIALADFFTGYRATAAKRGEILTGLSIPRLPVRSASLFLKKGKRRALFIAGVNAALRVDMGADGRVASARIALGSVAATTILSEAAAGLEGSPLDDDTIETAARAATEGVTPISDVRSEDWYRKRMVETLVRRGLAELRTVLTASEQEGA